MQTHGEYLAYIEAPVGERPIELRELEVQAVIAGLYAETTQTMVFFNPNSRPLEGSLTFPMPEGAVVCGYALDVEGRMVDGVVVAKQEARRILEAEIRKGVDPGLVEQVAGNLYRTRVYPLPALGTRRVRITYVSQLTVEGTGAHYHLPIPQAVCLQRVGVRLEVHQSPVEPALTGLPEIVLRAHQDCWVAEGDVPGDVPHDFHLVLPDLPERFAMVERTQEGEVFFCVSAAQQPAAGEVWRPRRLAVAWDASGSRTDCQSELEWLSMLSQQWPQLPVDLVVLRDRLEEPLAFADLTALVSFLEDLPADGATALAQLDLSRAPHPDCEGWLLFSDGLDTVAPALPGLGSLPVFAITSQLANNSALLSYLAERSEGLFINLTRLQVPQAVQLLTSRSSIRLPVNCQGGSQVHLARTPGRIQALGRLTAAEPYALVSTGPLEALQVEAQQARPGRLLARAWAGRELGAVQARGEDDQVALELGRRYGLVTPGASLLVLESLQQYLDYDICPAASQPEMRQAFLAMRKDRTVDTERQRHDRLEAVCSMWARRVAWWETDFRPAWEQFKPKPKPPEQMAAPLQQSHSLGAGLPGCAGGGGLANLAEESMEFSPCCDEVCAESPAEMDRMCEPCPAPPAPMMFAAMSAAPVLDPFASAPSDPFASSAADPFASGSVDAFGSAADPFASAGDPFASSAADPFASAPAPAPSASTEGGSPVGGQPQSSIAIKAWDPETPYLKALEEAGPERAYATFLRLRPDYASSPSFFLDCADHLLRQEQGHGLRVLSNLLEMGLDDPPLMRMYAWRLQQAGQLDDAVQVLERVLKLRPDEPQSYRDLGLVLADRWESNQDSADAFRAAELLYEVVHRSWDRFPEIELIALMELNRLLARAERAGVAMPSIDPRLHRLLDLDLRISMSWDADLTDVDLHVHEPTGEHAYYGQNRTAIGGLVSLDFRQGYGPEEYVLHHAYPGPYDIRAHYYGSHQQTLTGPCTVLVSVFTNYGRVDEERQLLTLRLDRPHSEESVGVVTVKAAMTIS